MLDKQKNKQPSSVLGEWPTVLRGLTSSMWDRSQWTEFVTSTVQVSCVVIALLWPFPGQPSAALCVCEGWRWSRLVWPPPHQHQLCQRSSCNSSCCSYISTHPQICWTSW